MSDSRTTVCARCGAVNRIHLDRPAEQARCGKCKTPLFDGHPVALSEQDFDRHLSRSGIPVLVDFWADWCGPCKAMAPVFAQAADELAPAVRVAKVDTERNPGLAARYGIRSIPSLLLFVNGREVARTAGAMDLGRLLAWVRQAAA